MTISQQQWGGGSICSRLHVAEKFFFWRPNFLGYHFPDIKNGFQVENIGSHYQSKNWLFWKNHIFFVENFPNHIINCKYGIFFDCFFVIFLFVFLQNFKFWNIGKMIKKITFFNKISSSYLWGFWRQFQRNVKKKSHFLTKFQVPTYGDFDVNFNEMWKMVLKKWVKLKWLRTCKHELAGSYYGRIL